MAVKSLAQSSLVSPHEVNSMLGGYSTNTFHHLETVRLGSSAASVTFSNLERYADYEHLQIRGIARGYRSSNSNTYMSIRFNNDSGANYWIHLLFGTGSGVTSYTNGTSGLTLGTIGWVPSNGATAEHFGGFVSDILDPFNSNKKTTVRSAVAGQGGAEPRVSLNSTLWNSSSPVSSITVLSQEGDTLAGSRISLYGLKVR